MDPGRKEPWAQAAARRLEYTKRMKILFALIFPIVSGRAYAAAPSLIDYQPALLTYSAKALKSDALPEALKTLGLEPWAADMIHSQAQSLKHYAAQELGLRPRQVSLTVGKIEDHRGPGHEAAIVVLPHPGPGVYAIQTVYADGLVGTSMGLLTAERAGHIQALIRAGRARDAREAINAIYEGAVSERLMKLVDNVPE